MNSGKGENGMSLTLLANAQVETLDQAGCQYDGILIKNDKILAVGKTGDLRLQGGSQIEVEYDLAGAYVLPGLVDSHLHLLSYGHYLQQLDLRQVTTKEELRRVIGERVSMTPVGKWIVGSGWDENRFPHREFITLAELNRWAPDHPVLLARTCYHTYMVNQRAYEQAGIIESTPNPEGGQFGCDGEGALNGYIYEHAYRLFAAAIPRPTKAEHRQALCTAVTAAQAKGLVGVHSDDLRELPVWQELFQLYGKVLAQHPLHIHELIDSQRLQEVKDAGVSYGPLSPNFSVGAVKYFADGALGGRTAWMSEAYLDRPGNRGISQFTDEELAQHVAEAVAAGLPVAVHAIGDAAAAQVIQAFAKHPPQQGRHRLVHAQVLRQELVQQLASLPYVIADIQPRFVASDFPWAVDALGEERLQYGYAWKTLLDAGIPCAGGSDAPIEPLDPLLGIHAAVTRRHPDETHEGYFPQEKLSIREAIGLFTQGSAYAAMMEGNRGKIAPGYSADFTVLSHNLLSPSMAAEPDQLLQVQVQGTMVAGQWVYGMGLS